MNDCDSANNNNNNNNNINNEGKGRISVAEKTLCEKRNEEWQGDDRIASDRVTASKTSKILTRADVITQAAPSKQQGQFSKMIIGSRQSSGSAVRSQDRSRKKFSHPVGILSPPALLAGRSSGGRSGGSPPWPCPPSPGTPTPGRSPAMRRTKKNSMPVPLVSLNNSEPMNDVGGGGDDDDVTRRLETAVRRISRGSQNRYDIRSSPLMGNSPNRLDSASGLSGLARGYEQYKEWLTTLRPTTEFGEASSDDLSSEWESSSEVESSPSKGGANGTTKKDSKLRPFAAKVGSVACAVAANLRRGRSRPNLEPNRGEEEGTNDGDDEGEGSKDKPSRNSTKRPSGWRKVRNMVQWTPFVQTFKNRRYQWVQLAGHSGNFKAGKSQGTVLKKLCPQEEHCYKLFQNDAIQVFVPEYKGTLALEDNEKFIQLQDCLSSFHLPSIMDCKIGVRTYLEEELAKAKEKPKLRNDMYNKMIAVDPSAPTEEENRLKGITKPRYMVWRETISSTATLGFRLEGIKMSDGTSSKDFKTTKTKDQVLDAFRNFTSGNREAAKHYVARLKSIREATEKSEFFRAHELIGSSLLFVHDAKKASVWLIDFGKTVPVPEDLNIDHKSPWEVGNHEDGYLIGVDNLIAIFQELSEVYEREAAESSHSAKSKKLSSGKRAATLAKLRGGSSSTNNNSKKSSAAAAASATSLHSQNSPSSPATVDGAS